MSHLNEIIQKINGVCKEFAGKKGFDLPPVGGYIKKNNEHGGTWTFVTGEGSYKEKDGEMQWKLHSIK